MGTDKNAARYQDWDNATVKAPYLPRSTLFGPSLKITAVLIEAMYFDVPDVWPVCCRLPWNFGGLPTMPIGFAGIGSQ